MTKQISHLTCVHVELICLPIMVLNHLTLFADSPFQYASDSGHAST